MSAPGQNSSPNQSPPGSQSQSNNTGKGTIERGASWSYNETRILLSLWGQDMVQRQLTNSKRTRHVWEKIAERIREHGFERTPDQVRTRVFNMIAEYRRILKNPTPERKKKCIFFDALHRIYQAKDANGVRAALNYSDDDYNQYSNGGNFYNDMDFAVNDETNDAGIGDGGDADNSGTDNEEIFAYQMSPSQTLNGPASLNGGHHQTHEDSSDGLNNNEDYGLPRNPAKRARAESTTANLHQYSASPFSSYNSYDGSLAILIDRMFTHLSKETEAMRDWIKLEKERFNREAARRKEEHEREERREKAFLDTLMKMQEQTFSFLSTFTGTSKGQPIPTSTSQGTSSAQISATTTSTHASELINNSSNNKINFYPSSNQLSQITPSSSFNLTDACPQQSFTS